MKTGTTKCMRKIDQYVIEYPATCCGASVGGSAFVRGNYASDFVTLHGNGQISVGDGIRGCLNNKRVVRFLTKLSHELGG